MQLPFFQAQQSLNVLAQLLQIWQYKLPLPTKGKFGDTELQIWQYKVPDSLRSIIYVVYSRSRLKAFSSLKKSKHLYSILFSQHESWTRRNSKR